MLPSSEVGGSVTCDLYHVTSLESRVTLRSVAAWQRHASSSCTRPYVLLDLTLVEIHLLLLSHLACVYDAELRKCDW